MAHRGRRYPPPPILSGKDNFQPDHRSPIVTILGQLNRREINIDTARLGIIALIGERRTLYQLLTDFCGGFLSTLDVLNTLGV